METTIIILLISFCWLAIGWGIITLKTNYWFRVLIKKKIAQKYPVLNDKIPWKVLIPILLIWPRQSILWLAHSNSDYHSESKNYISIIPFTYYTESEIDEVIRTMINEKMVNTEKIDDDLSIIYPNSNIVNIKKYLEERFIVGILTGIISLTFWPFGIALWAMVIFLYFIVSFLKG